MPTPAAPRADDPEYEPPPAEPPPPAPPLPPAPPSPPKRLAASRVYFQLAAGATALVWQGVYGFGGSVEIGLGIRLRFGALGLSARLGLEQHIQPEPAPLVLPMGAVLTYAAGRPHWRAFPYAGVFAQAMLQRLPDSIGAIPLQRDQSGLVLGGLVGGQLRLGRGGLYTEVGYRGAVTSPTAAAVPAWNTVALQLGYRLILD
jgi:hypothetical protein